MDSGVGVNDGLTRHRDRHHLTTSGFDRLLDGGRNFLCLAVTDGHLALAITDHDQRGEAETTTTLDDLGHTVDLDYAFVVLALFVIWTLLTCHQWTALSVVGIKTPILPREQRPRELLSFRETCNRPRSKTTKPTPASLARLATRVPTFDAVSVVKVSDLRADSCDDAAASVWPARSSIT